MSDPSAPDRSAAAAPASLSEQLITLCGRPVTDADAAQATRLLLDWCGLSFAAVNENGGRAVRDATKALATEGPCVAFAAGDMTAEQAAFVNGALGTLLEMDDLHRASILHAGDVVLPAALAAAQSTKASGRQLAEAIVLGYEVALRIGQAAASGGYTAWYNSASCGVFGAAMAAAHAAGASERAKLDALGQAGMQASGLWQCRLEPTDSKPVATAHAARAGVSSAFLALHGARGAKGILDGRLGFFPTFYPDADPGAVMAHPEANWMIHEVSFKPWPACRHVHPAVGLALDLGHGEDLGEIAGIEIETYAAAIEFCDQPDPQTPHQGRFSLQHCIAVALTTGDLRLEDTQPEAFCDPGTAALRRKITLREAADLTAEFPQKMGARMIVSRVNGTRHAAASDHALGDPERPLNAAALSGKFNANLASVGVSAEDASDLAAAIAGLPQAKTLEDLNAALRAVSHTT
ncbi:MAG: MmgE/PrpD family protein [Paracoccaceae bacterium]